MITPIATNSVGLHRPRSRGIAVLGVLLAALAACQPQAGSTSVTPGGEGAAARGASPEGQHEDDSAGSLKARLENLASQRASKLEPASTDPGVCEELCSLATTICSVQEKLCELADEHAGDDEYQGLCREARQECREAQDSCVACVESNSARPESATSTK